MEFADDLALDLYLDENELDESMTFTLEDIKNAFLNGYGSGWEDRGKCKIDF